MKEGNIKLSKYATAPVFFRAFELNYKIIKKMHLRNHAFHA
jgi:hypothetical protein